MSRAMTRARSSGSDAKRWIRRQGVGSSVVVFIVAVLASSVFAGANAAYVHNDPATSVYAGYAHPGCMRVGNRCPGIKMSEVSDYKDYQTNVMDPFNLPKFVSAFNAYTSTKYGSASDYQRCTIVKADENAGARNAYKTYSPNWLGPLQFTYTCGW